jgi:hypothetical protein
MARVIAVPGARMGVCHVPSAGGPCKLAPAVVRRTGLLPGTHTTLHSAVWLTRHSPTRRWMARAVQNLNPVVPRMSDTADIHAGVRWRKKRHAD